jgi:nitrite reductase/ring-hydroxylating ferredoxin subunit
MEVITMGRVLIPVGKVKDLLPGGSLGVEVNEKKIAVYNVSGEFFALDALCPHEGGPLERGSLEGYWAVCPWHLWKFDVRTGQLETDTSICVERYNVHVEGDQIFIDFTEAHQKATQWEKILNGLENGKDPVELASHFHVSINEIDDAVRRHRVGERLIWLGKLYQERGLIRPMDLLRMPKRNEKGISYAVIPLIDELTASL